MFARPPVGVVPPAPIQGPAGDLPTPVHRSTALTFKVPTVDLPTPARPGAGAGQFRAPEPPPFQSGGHTGTTPMVTGVPSDASMISVGDLDLPSPAEHDLPMPAGLIDLPAPIDLELLAPADTGLLTPSAGGQLTPAGLDLEPAHILPRPADQSLAPADQHLTPAQRVAARAAAEGAAPEPFGLDPSAARRSPSPRAVSTSAGRRPLLLVGGGLALFAVVGGGAWAVGVFDPPADVPVTTTRTPPNKSDGKSPTVVTTAIDRTPEVLALLANDTPASYLAAIAAAEKAGDPVGQAEASLGLQLRYGPDSVRQGQAAAWLQPFAAQTEPFVRRAVGLSLLVTGALAEAEAALADDGPRTRLYRGWLRLAQGRDADAVVEADAVLAATPADVAAIGLRHEARAIRNAQGEMTAVEASLAAHAKHPGLMTSAVRVAIAAGQLRQARLWLDAIPSSPEAGPGFDAVRLRLRAQLEDAAGSAAKAARHYEEAGAIVPTDRSLGLARVSALTKAGRLSEADVAIRGLVEANPDDIRAVLLRAEVQLESGQGDKALELVTAIETKWPGRADAAHMLGRVHAMRLQAPEARAAFSTAITRDPLNVAASISEAQMLVRLDQLGDALAVLDTARKRVADAGAKPNEALVLRAKAAILTKAGQGTAALAALDQALLATPWDNAALLARGLLRIDIGQQDAGRADLLAVYERTGAFVGLTAPLGRIFVREGAIDRLEGLVGDGLEDPDADSETLVVGARLRLAQGKPEEAKVVLQRALLSVPNDWEAHLLLAQAQLDAGDFAEALVQIDRSTPTVPSAEKQLLRGKILEYNARHDEARPEYLKALQIDPTLVEARFLYGRLAAHKGEAKLAADQLAQVVSETDRFPEAFLNLGRAQRDLGETAKAIVSLDRAIVLDDTLLEAQYLRGRALFETNAMAKAAESFAAAAVDTAQNQPWYPEALIFLGRARASEGKRKEAREAFEKFLAVAPAEHPSRADAERQVAELR